MSDSIITNSEYSWQKHQKREFELDSKSPIETITELIEGAHDMIVVADPAFLNSKIRDVVMVVKKRDVRSYVLTEDDALPNDVDSKQVISCLEMTNSTKTLVRTYAGLAVNAILIDPFERSRGLLFGGFRDSYEGGVYEELHGEENKEIRDILGWLYWENAKREVASKIENCKPLGKLLQPEPYHVLYARQNVQDEISKTICGASNVLTVSGRCWHVHMERVCELARNGTKVTVITRPDDLTPNNIMKIRDAGVQIVGSNGSVNMIISDSVAVLISDVNNGHFEIGIKREGRKMQGMKKKIEQIVKKPDYELKC
ncbi:MAG: hypothetical protein OXC46_06140 [Thaumarchaeota archaeon]|nr:hypothetical protein [Nitrososphaerota archaeon]